MATKRVTKHWELNKGYKNGEELTFNLEEIDKSNFVNYILALKKEDMTFSTFMELFGSFKGKMFANIYDTFTVPAGYYIYQDKNGKKHSNKNPFKTTFGLWIFNVCFLRDNNLAEQFGYINETIGDKKFKKIQQTLIYALLEDRITLDDYKLFLEYTQFTMPFETVLSPNHTEKIVTCTKVINKKKAELYKKYKDKIDAGDPTVIEKMEKELLDFAKEYIGEDPGLDVYLSDAGASWGNNFKNLYVMKGAMRDPDPNAQKQFNAALSNWIDGVSADEYSIVANGLAAGPYSRSKKTELGGYWEKLITAAFSTLKLDGPGTDCGTKKYIEVTITEDNYTQYMYNYVIKSDGKLEELTSESIKKYMNKKVKMRFSMFCKSKTGICNCCAGNFFYRRGSDRVGMTIAQIPAKLKLINMKQFHDSTISTYEIDPFEMFGLRK